MQPKLVQIIVLVSDMQRSVVFYKDILELPVVTESEWWSEFVAGNVSLALHPGQRNTAGATSGTDAGTTHLSFAVPDLDRACADLRAKGVAVDGPRTLEGMEHPNATFSDPDGLSLELRPA